MLSFLRDVRLGFRSFARERLFAVSVTSILAIGIAAAVTMFSVLQGVVLRPLPYPHAGELAVIASHSIPQNQFEGTSAANFTDWQRASRAFAAMTLYRRTSASRVVVTTKDGPTAVQEGLVDSQFFRVVGAATLAGRTFSDDDFSRSARVVVLSEEFWRDHFVGAGDAIGQSLTIAGEPHLVIGVMPQSFRLPTSDTKLWRPLAVLNPWWTEAQTVRDGDSFEVIGRVAAGVGVTDASAEMRGIAQRLRETYAENRDLDVRVTPLLEHVVGARTIRGMWIGFGAVVALLAVACANAGSLIIARAVRRRRELVVRAALGAGAGRLVRQLLAETVSLWLVASAVGAAIAAWLVRAILALAPAGLPRLADVGFHAGAALLACVTGLAMMIVCGVVPAVIAPNAGAALALRTRDMAGAPRQRLQQAMVMAQVAGAVTLLIAGLLLVRSFLRVNAVDPGYQPQQLIIARIDRPSIPNFFLQARARLQSLPGVVAVGGITDFFIRRAGDQRVTIEGRSAADAVGRLPKLVIDSVTPGYFRAMDIGIIEGREFDDRDVQPGGTRSVIVSEGFARRYWPAESAVGKRLVGGAVPPSDGRWATVIGVVKDLRREGLDVPATLSVFLPALLQRMDMTIRTAADPAPLIPDIRRELRSVDALLPLPTFVAARATLDERLAARSFEMQALVIFSSVALLLAAAGLYVSLAYQVSLRTREIGIRVALGARRAAIVWLFVRRGVFLGIGGVIGGLAGARVSAGILQSLLYETSAVDGGSYVAVAAVVLVVSLIAAGVPARRAARVNPMIVLREG